GVGDVLIAELVSATMAVQLIRAYHSPGTIGHRGRGRALLPTIVHVRTRRGGAMSTMSDIAREAGVSLSTVSYALSGKRTISESTRELLYAAISRLIYHPHKGTRPHATLTVSSTG